ncbi:MAG: hypothetical protein WEA61_11230 [Anaerolineales bacterium]
MKKKKSLAYPANGDLSALRNRVMRRREYLDLLETELANTRAIVQEFTRLYEERIRPLDNEQKRLSRLLDQLTADQKPPASGWRGRGPRPRQAAPNGNQEADPFPKKKPSTNKDAQYERKVRELFRRLAKQYHPDLAQDAESKERCEKVMAEINRAYQAKDLEMLQALANCQAKGHRSSKLPEAEWARLKLELRQLDAMIFEIEQTIRELDLSPAMQMQSETRGERPGRHDVLAEMEADYRTRISELQEQLLGLGMEIE